MTSNQCISCKHYMMQKQCEAFPEEIPQEIFDGTFIHDKKFPGQENDIIYEELKDIDK